MPHDDATTDSRRTEGLSLRLHIPEQGEAPVDSFLLDPKSAGEWLESLPVANIGETARLTFNALVDANRMEMPDLVRTRVVELFREPVRYLCQNLEKHFLELGFPLSEKSHKAAMLARELNAELAIGYKIIVERMLQEAGKRFDGKLLVLALHRATLYLGQVLYRSTLVYEPWPPAVWRELNTLYAYAEQNRLQGVTVKDSLGLTSAQETSVDRAFRHVLLFAAMNPSRMRQADIRQAFAKAGEWTSQVRIEPFAQQDSKVGLYVIDLGGDSAPTHAALGQPSDGRRLRLLNLQPLLKALREQFDRGHEPDPGAKILSPRLLRDVISRWNEPPKRRYVRTHLNFELYMLAGIKSIHHAMTRGSDEPQTAPMAPPPRPRAAPSSPHVPVWAEGASADLGNLGLAPLESGLADHAAPTATLTPSPSSGTPAVEQNAEWRTPKTPVRQHAPYPVQTFDESAGGYCIRWPVEHPTKVKVGEILGIRSGEDNARFAVGVVRWMRQDPARELELGVQIIASRCQPGDIGTTRMKHRARDPEKPHHNCLLLPETRPDERDTSLVTTAANIEPGSTLWLSTRGIERRIKLTRIMESCGAFTRYEFQLIGEEETPKRSSGTPGHGFDDLWNQL